MLFFLLRLMVREAYRHQRQRRSTAIPDTRTSIESIIMLEDTPRTTRLRKLKFYLDLKVENELVILHHK